MSRDETPDTTGLREAGHAEIARLCTPGERWRMSIPANPERDSDLILTAAIDAAQPTPDASPDPAVVTPDAGDVAEWLRDARLSGCNCNPLVDGQTCSPCLRDRILASDWLANHVAAAREADRAEVWDEGYRVGREDERTKGQFIRFTEDNPYREAES